MKLSTVLVAGYFLLGPIQRLFAQGAEPTKECLSSRSVRSITTYHLAETSDTLHPTWKRTDFEEYDRAGNQLLWKQYEMALADTGTYSKRAFTYNTKGQLVKTTDCQASEAVCMVNSLRLDENGYVAYRRMLYRPGKVLFEHEVTLQVERNKSGQPVKITAFDKKGTVQSHEELDYDKDSKLLSEKTFAKNAVVQQTIYRYHKSGKLAYTATVKGERDTTETKTYDSSARLAREVKFNEEDKGSVSYVVVRSYDSKSREVTNVTYSKYGTQLVATRREASTYSDSCLRTGTKIYSVDYSSGKEVLYTVIKYTYSFY